MAHQMFCPPDQELGLSRTRPRDDYLVAIHVMEGLVPAVRLDSNVCCAHGTIVGSCSLRECLWPNHQDGLDTERPQVGNRVGEDLLRTGLGHRMVHLR